jgi:hypothetical protein
MIDDSSVNPNLVHASLSFCLMIGTDKISEKYFVVQENGQSKKLSNQMRKILSANLSGLDTLYQVKKLGNVQEGRRKVLNLWKLY